MVKAVAARMMDPELPVSIESAIAFPKLLTWEVAKSMVLAELNNIFTTYIKLMDQIDNEDLVDALQSVIVMHKEHIPPHAVNLT